MGELTRFAAAVGYPEDIPSAAAVFPFRIDGADVIVAAEARRFTVRRDLAKPGDEVPLERLASLAAGRLLREEATLAWDGEAGVPFLWQEIALDSSDAELRRAFDRFLASADWWLERVDEAERPEPSFPEMVIMP